MSQPVFIAPRTRALRPQQQRHGLPGHDLLPRPAAAHPAPHAVMLRGLGPVRGQGPLEPTIVARTEDDFIAAVQALLAEPDGAARLAEAMEQLPRDAQGRLLLYPPVQRVHQLVLVEACCAEPGFPRLDPRKIASAGLVIRRPQPAGEAGPHGAGWLAWQRRGEQAVGWVPLARRGGTHGVGELDDPDARQRQPFESSGNAHVDAALLKLSRSRSRVPVAATPPSERVVPLHPLPEALCATLGRTLLVAYLPVASDEVVDDPTPLRAAASADEVAALQQHLMHYLRGGGLKALPRPDERVSPDWLEAINTTPDGTEDSGSPSPGRWLQALMQLHLEFDLAGSDADALPLQQAFSAFRVLRVDPEARAAVDRLAPELCDVWLAEISAAARQWQPTEWREAATAGKSVPQAATLLARLLQRWREAGAPQRTPQAEWLPPWLEAQAAQLGLELLMQPDMARLAAQVAAQTGLGAGGFLPWGGELARVLYEQALQQALQQAQAHEQQGLRCALRFLAGVELAPALPFVASAIGVLVGEPAAPQALTQPGYWAPVDEAAALAFAQAAAERVRQREAAMFSGTGKRLSEPGVPQALRCFVRLKPATPSCPPQLAWGGHSALFTVAPWWESGPAKPRVVDMPDPFDRATLRKLRPSIGFAMPGRLGNLMTPANLDKLKDGKKPSEGGGLGLDWICGFNIPIITLCALIVLNIFLQLMNIVFWWLPFVKICLPIPAKKGP